MKTGMVLGVGFEPCTSPNNDRGKTTPCTPDCTVCPLKPSEDTGLSEVIARWNTLSEPLKDAVLAIVRTASESNGGAA